MNAPVQPYIGAAKHVEKAYAYLRERITHWVNIKKRAQIYETSAEALNDAGDWYGKVPTKFVREVVFYDPEVEALRYRVNQRVASAVRAGSSCRQRRAASIWASVAP